MVAPARSARGKYAVMLFIPLVALAVTGAWLALERRPVADDFIELINVDGDFAIAVRAVRGDPHRSFLSMYEYRTGEQWGALIPAYTGAPGRPPAVAATAEVVAVRTVANGQPTLLAFGGARGHKIGRIEPLGTEQDTAGTGFSLPAASHVFAAGETFELFGNDGQWAKMFALDLTSGAVRWRADLGALSIRRVWLRAAHVLIDTHDALLIMDRRTGQIALQVATGQGVCVVGDEVYAGDRGVVRVISLDNGLAAREVATGDAGATLAGLCGYRGQNTLLALAHPDGTASLLAVDRATLEPVWRTPVSAPWYLDPVALGTPDRAPLSGVLPRFVPVLLGTPSRMAMLDTDTGRLLWQSPAAFAGAHLMREDDLHYLYEPQGPRLAVFDGATGELTAALRLSSHAPVWPRQIAGQRIWVFAGATWAVLDARTLQTIPGAGTLQAGTDARADLARELGLSTGH